MSRELHLHPPPVCEVDHEAGECLPGPAGEEAGQGLHQVHGGLLPAPVAWGGRLCIIITV